MNNLVIPETPKQNKTKQVIRRSKKAQSHKKDDSKSLRNSAFSTAIKHLTNSNDKTPQLGSNTKQALPFWAVMHEDLLNPPPPRKMTKKRYWTSDEDDLLRKLVKKHGAKNWKKISSHFKNRTDVQCLHRW